MKTDFEKEKGHVVNLDNANDYLSALSRRQRNNRINELLELLPELKKLLALHKDEL